MSVLYPEDADALGKVTVMKLLVVPNDEQLARMIDIVDVIVMVVVMTLGIAILMADEMNTPPEMVVVPLRFVKELNDWPAVHVFDDVREAPLPPWVAALIVTFGHVPVTLVIFVPAVIEGLAVPVPPLATGRALVNTSELAVSAPVTFSLETVTLPAITPKVTPRPPAADTVSLPA